MKLTLGYNLMLGSARSAPPAFNPATLPGYVDSPFSFAELRAAGKLWQNTAQTIPAVAGGDPIRRAACGASNWDAPSDSARPLLTDEGGGKWSVAFDGVDDSLRATGSAQSQPLSLGARIRIVSVNGGGNQFWGCWRDNCAVIIPAGTTRHRLFAGGSTDASTASGLVPDTVIGVFNGASSVILATGVEVVGNAGVNGQVGTISIGTDPALSAPAAVRISGIVFCRAALSLSQRNELASYLGAL